MSKYVKMVDSSEDELMHYGVLGMKWHHHKAKSYQKAAEGWHNQANKHLNSMKDIAAIGYKEGAKVAYKNYVYATDAANKFERKAEKHLAKNQANLDKKLEKIKKKSKYVSLEKENKLLQDVYDQSEKDYKAGHRYERSDKLEEEAARRNVAKADKIMAERNKHWKDMVNNDFMVFNDSKYTVEDMRKAMDEFHDIQDKLNKEYVNSKEYNDGAYKEVQNNRTKWMSENAAKQEELLAPKKKYLKYTTL